MKKKIMDYAPPVENKESTYSVSCRIPLELAEEVNKIRKISWRKLIEACLKKFVDEEKPKGK